MQTQDKFSDYVKPARIKRANKQAKQQKRDKRKWG